MSEEGSNKLNIARRKLNTVLADQAPTYFNLLKQWFRLKSTKEKFDAEARKLINPEQIHYHNEFLLALLNRVSGLAEMSVSMTHERSFYFGKNVRKQRATTTSADPDEMPRFDPVDLMDYLSPNSPQGAGSDGVKYAAQEVFLPDHPLVMGRFMLAAWDHDLEGVEDDAANYVVAATQVMLKNVLTAVISQMKPYKTKGRMMYDLGADAPNMWLRNTAKVINPQGERQMPLGAFGGAVGHQRPPTVDEIEHSAALEMACSAPENDGEVLKLTVDDVYTALMENRNVIGSHTVYSVNMERMALMLSHPSN